MVDGELKKIQSSITCGKELRLKIKSKQPLLEPPYGKQQFEFKVDEEVTYKLISTVNHIGSTFKSGHYVCHQFDDLDGRRCLSDTSVS